MSGRKNPTMDLTILRTNRDKILATAARHGASNVRVFGSVARGDAGPESDVDFLVDLEPGRGLLDLGGLLMDLEELLDCQVDIGLVRSLRGDARERVLTEAVAL
jgi:predicted nucleotidyltransferase